MVHLIPTVGFTGAILATFDTLGIAKLVPLGILSGGTLGSTKLVPLVYPWRGLLGSLCTLGYTLRYLW